MEVGLWRVKPAVSILNILKLLRDISISSVAPEEDFLPFIKRLPGGQPSRQSVEVLKMLDVRYSAAEEK